MSNPRYDWWGYIKAIIRRYPSSNDPVMSMIRIKEKNAVREAIEATKDMKDGTDRLKIIDMVFWKKTHTLSGAAMRIPCSERTARRWHTEFIKEVAKNFGLID